MEAPTYSDYIFTLSSSWNVDFEMFFPPPGFFTSSQAVTLNNCEGHERLTSTDNKYSYLALVMGG